MSIPRASLFFSEFGGRRPFRTQQQHKPKRSINTMTAVTTTTVTPCNGNSSSDAEKSRSESFVPSSSEEEAKTRFKTSVAAGIDFLMCRGVGREQASRELLNMVANGCSPDEEEIFNVMETCGLSFDDATKVITVAAAFKAANTGGATSKIEAIDQMTSRLNFSRLTIKNEVRSSSLSSSSSTSSLPSSPNKQSVHNISRKDCAGGTSPTAFTKRNNKHKAKGDKVGRPIQKGKKRALPPRAEDTNNNSSTDIEVKEKMLQAKLKDGKRAKSPESKQRAKRTPVQQLEESQATKRARGNPPDAASSCSKEVL